MKYRITVRAVTLVPELHVYDTNVPGDYRIEASSKEAALDEFHATVPIKVLDDFDITVTEEA